MPVRLNATFLAVLACGLGLHVAGLLAQQPRSASPPTATERIAYYAQQIADHPRHYPAQALLAAAWLDKARQSYDPRDLAQARAAFQRSLDIQPSFEALKGMAAACNYGHRFEQALAWCQRAAEAAPEDTALIAMQVEAYLALGRTDDARRCLDERGNGHPDFYLAASRGQWNASQGQTAEAVQQFLAAARVAQQQQAMALAVWGQVSAAGALLDAGKLLEARPLLEAAAKSAPADSFLRMHQAELAEAEGRFVQALAMVEEVLREQADPELHRRAHRLALQIHDAAKAREHFSAAERLCRQSIEHGEAYGFQTLADLYCDARVQLDQALRLAEQNLQFKRDTAAEKTLARSRNLQAEALATVGVRTRRRCWFVLPVKRSCSACLAR